MRRRGPSALPALAAVLLAAPAGAASDLVPEIYAVALARDQRVGAGDVAEGCAAATEGRTLLRFGVRAHNVGPEALVVGSPGCPDCAAHPGAACADPRFECSPADGHDHPHFRTYMLYELLDPTGEIVARSRKQGFCFRDSACEGRAPAFVECETAQGISAGCHDDYGPELGCQYLDVTDVEGIERRAFRLRVTVDALHALPDADRTNDVVEVWLPGCGDGLVQPGETCDAGPAGSACCDADCRLAPAGTECRPAAGPCDAAERCDGLSPDCPSDVRRPDGASCAEPTPCRRAACRAGRCVAEPAGEGCAIDGTCVPAGEADPADGCRLCLPALRDDGWSPNAGPDRAGLGCQLARVAATLDQAACPRRVGRRATRLLGRLAGRLASAPAAARRVRRPLARLERLLVRAGRRALCDTGPALAALGVLGGPLEAFAASGRNAERR
jgi:hypothetical protein